MLMSFTDPQTVTISGAAVSLPRVSTEGDETVYRSADATVELSVGHSVTGKGRLRHSLRVDHSKIGPDWQVPSENKKESMSVNIVFDLPQTGYTAVEAKAVYDGFIAQVQASSAALITKLLAGES